MTSTETDPQDLNTPLIELFMTPEGRADPIPRYTALREGTRIFRSAIDAWVVGRWDDCQFVLRDPRFGKETDRSTSRLRRFGLTEEDMEAYPALNRGAPSMLFLNPPDHTRLRGLVSKAFTPRTVEALRPGIARLTDELLDEMAEAGEVDVMKVLAFPLPVTVIGELLGIPEPDRAQFQHLVRAGTALLELTATPEVLRAANDASETMVAYFHDLIAARRRAPGDDLLSHLIAVEEAGDQLTTEELISTMILLFAAGFETTTNLIGNGLYALLRHPDQQQRLRDDPSLLRPGVEELLRFDSPVQVNGRMAFEDVAIGEATVPAGETVVTLLGAANRDPRHFSAPDTLDVGRSEGAPLSFGSGIHFCLGAALARAEGQVVFGRLLDRFPTIELLDDQPPYRDSLTLRGLETLPVRVRS
jgi:cytochrome P450